MSSMVKHIDVARINLECSNPGSFKEEIPINRGQKADIQNALAMSIVHDQLFWILGLHMAGFETTPNHHKIKTRG